MAEMAGKSSNKLTATLLFLLVSCLISSCANHEAEQIPLAEITSIVQFTPTSTVLSTLPLIPFTATPLATSTPEIEIVVLDKSTSPDGNWTAVVFLTTQDTKKSLEFRVSNNSSEQKWAVEQMDWDELQTSTSWVDFPYIFKWSDDGQSLFYSYEPNSNDGCFGYFRPGGYGLKRLDLANGNISVIREENATWMALSPDETQLAYIDDFGGNVSLVEIKNGREREYALPAIKNEHGYITDTKDLYWSPDGKSLIYAHYVGACDLLVPYINIIQLYPDTGQQIILVDNSERGYVPQGWITKNEILLQDMEGNQWRLSPATKEITPNQQ